MLEKRLDASVICDSLYVSHGMKIKCKSSDIIYNGLQATTGKLAVQIKPLSLISGNSVIGKLVIDDIRLSRVLMPANLLHLNYFEADLSKFNHSNFSGKIYINTQGAFSQNNQEAGSFSIDHEIWLDRLRIKGESSINNLKLPVLALLFGSDWETRIQSGLFSWSMRNTAGEFSLRDTTLNIPQIANDIIDLPPIYYSFTAKNTSNEWKGLTGDARIQDIRLSFIPSLIDNQIQLKIELPPSGIQSILDTIPSTLLGELGEVKIRGNVEWHMQMQIPLQDTKELQWESSTEYSDILLEHLPDSINVFRLEGPFLHHITDPTIGYDRVIRIGPMSAPDRDWLEQYSGLDANRWEELLSRRPAATSVAVMRARSPLSHRFFDKLLFQDPNYHFVPLQSISPWIPLAVVTAEDGEFFRHRGINWRSVQHAIERNLNEGEYSVGASTIPMQLVKNLFLDQDKVLARKLQEALLVMLMEQVAAIPKDRQLEVYLNIVEFGPGIYGIHDACNYYFNKTPDAITPIEAVWLASVLPSPKRFHYYYDAGEVSEAWLERMQHILEIMHARQRISDQDFEQAMQEKPQFAYPEKTKQIKKYKSK